MRKLKSFCLFLFAGAILISSCKKDEVLNSGVTKKCYPTIVKQNNFILKEFSYLSDNRLDVFKNNDSVNGSPATYKMIYSGTRMIKALDTRSMGTDSIFYQFAYNADNTVKTSEMMYVSGGERTSVMKMELEYNALKQVNKMSITYAFLGPEPYMNLNFEYDAKGNNTKMEAYSTEDGKTEHLGTFEYEFDDRKNPLYFVQLPIIDWQNIPAGPNNIVKTTLKQNGETEIILSNYTYNTNGYPELVKTKDYNGKDIDLSYMYDCK